MVICTNTFTFIEQKYELEQIFNHFLKFVKKLQLQS